MSDRTTIKQAMVDRAKAEGLTGPDGELMPAMDKFLEAVTDGIIELPPLETADLYDGVVTDAKIGDRTVDQTQTPAGNTGTLTQLLSWFANRVKAITGAANWFDNPIATIAAIWAKFNASAGHKHTGAPDDGPQIDYANIANKPSQFTPAPHKNTHATGGSDALSPSDIGAETPAGAQAKVDAHANRTDNPHRVTVGQLGAASDPHGNEAHSVEFWHAGNDGVGSGLDADLVRGRDLAGELDTHGNSATGIHGVGDAKVAKTSRSDQWPDWNDIQGKPSTFPPSTHDHEYTTKLGISLSVRKDDPSEPPQYPSLIQIRQRGYPDAIKALSGEGDYFYCADRNPRYTITANYGSNVNALFDGNMANNVSIPLDTLATTPWVLTITSDSTITATDVLGLLIIGHRLGTSTRFRKWKVETLDTSGTWRTALYRENVSDAVGFLHVPLHVRSEEEPSYHWIKGIRITIYEADETSWSPGNVHFAAVQLRDWRPSMSPARGVGALDIRGGDMFGDVDWKYGVPKVNGYTVWHGGNDGAGSGLDADLVQGRDLASEFDSHTGDTSNPHSVTASQVGALPLSGGTLNGDLNITGDVVINGSGDVSGAYAPLIVKESGGNSLCLGGNEIDSMNEALHLQNNSTYKSVKVHGEIYAGTAADQKVWHAGNDGAGSGLDADLLDGKHASDFATASHNHDSTYVKLSDYEDTDVLAKIKNVDGSGSGLDADLLDGWHRDSIRDWNNLLNKPSTFPPSSHTHDDRYYTESEADSRFVNTSGDTINGKLYINNHSFGGSPVIALAVGDTDTGLHSDTDGRLEFWTNNGERAYLTSSEFNSLVTLKVNGNTVWHAGNDGAGSGLDADLVRGRDLASELDSHTGNTSNPHSVTAAQVGAIASIDGVSNAGGDVDLLASNSIKITPDDANNRITIGETHSNRTDNPHNVTPAQIGAVNKAGDSMTGVLSVPQLATSTIGKITPVYIRGTGLNHNGNRLVKVGGTTLVNSSGRGLTLTILKASDHSHISSTNYDTYGSATASDDLATALNNLTRDQIGILTSYDAFENKITSNLRAAARRLGLFKLANAPTGARRPYAAIFYGSGTASGNTEPGRQAMEVMQSNDADAPYAVIVTWLMDDGFVGQNVVNALVSAESNAADPVVYTNSAGEAIFSSTPKVGTNVIWHAGNDGAGSGLDADLVQGRDLASEYDALVQDLQTIDGGIF